MVMEGINWEGISQESSLISKYADTFTKSFYTASQNLLDELCGVWASGNAIKFAHEFANEVQNGANLVIKYNSALVDKLMKAAEIYSSTFNVNVSISKVEGLLAEKIDHNIQEKVKGITGMDKEHVRGLISEYQANVKQYCDDYEFGMNTISVSLYDTAGVQKEYFSEIVKQIVKEIYNTITAYTNAAQKAIENEIDALNAARQSVLNIFND